jgi:hypothetical protein
MVRPVLKCMQNRALSNQCREEVMLSVTVANIGELSVVGCAGKILERESVVKLREAVTSQMDARIVVLELSEVRTIGGGGLACSCFCNSGRGNTTSGSCYSTLPRQSKVN